MKTLLTKFFLLFVVFFYQSIFAQVNLADGLVAYYPFNGNAQDVSGNNNNGTSFGNVNFVTDPFGNPGSAVSFGGTANQGRISISHSSSLNFTTGASFAFWVRVNSAVGTFGNGTTGVGGSQCFFAKAGDAGNGFWQLSRIEGGNTLRHQIGNNGMSSLTGDFTPYTLNQWVHYAVTMDANGHKTYVNGILQASNETAANFAAMANRNLVLGRFNTNWYPFNGAMDEFRVYNRVLNEQEIMALANNELGSLSISYDHPIEVCAGNSITVNYQANGSYLANNQFQIQLSTPDGNFTNPIVLKRINGVSANGSASLLLPPGLPSGTQYRIRIASTVPAANSESGFVFSINGTTGNIPDPTLFTYVGHANGRDYFRSLVPQNWNTARAICLNNGGHLASIPNAEVNQLIFENAGNGRVYIGLNDIQTEGLFVWENDNRLSYTNWAPNQPDNASNEDVVELRNDNGQWNDINGTAARHYFLELNPAGVTRSICEGESVTLTAPNIAGASYLWSGPNGFVSLMANPTISAINPNQAGVYSLQYTVNGCTSPLYQTIVEVIPLPKNIGQSQTLSPNLSQGIQLQLPLDGNGIDISGNNQNATLVGGITPVNDRFGNENSALQLNGTNGHLTLPAGVYFNGTDFSVNAWVRRVSNNNWSRLFDFGNGPANNNVLVALTAGTNGRPTAEIYNGTTTAGQIQSAIVMSNNQWQMITYTWSNGGGQLFVNGNLVAQGPQSTPNNVIRNLNYIGRSNWNSDAFANAALDDFRIYNRVLSNEEIRELLYEQPNPLTVVLDSDEVCSGQSNTIILENTQPGLSYQLRLNSNNSNIGVAQTGNGGSLSFTINAIAETTEYHFLISNPSNTCAQLVSSIFSVPVNILPDAPLTTGDSVCSSGTLTLQAEGAPANGFYNWYLFAEGGNPIEGETSNTFTTPLLNVSKTYFVSITNENDCEGPRAPVLAEVVNPLAPFVDLNSGLILHSKFDGNLLDNSGNNLNASVLGGTSSFVNDRNGNEASALNLSNSAYLNYGNPGIVQQLTNQVTISLWIRQSPSNWGFVTPLLNKWQNNGLFLGLDSYLAAPNQPNENRVRWRVNAGTVINSNTNIIHNRWHHIVVTYNGQHLRIFQDGVQTGQALHTGVITNTITNLEFGRLANGMGNVRYRGDVDEIKLYNRALSLQEIQTLYNNESVAFANSPLCDELDNLTLTTFDFPGATYQWTGPNGFTSNLQNPNVIINADADTYAGEYQLIITNGDGCTSEPQTVNVVIHPIPEAPELEDVTICGSGNAVFEVQNPPTGVTYRWYLTADSATPIQGANGSTLTVNNITQQTSRFVSAVQNGCESPRTEVTAFYFSNVNPNVNVGGNTVCFNAANVTVEIPQSELGVQYQALLGNIVVSETETGTGGDIQLLVDANLLNLGLNTLTINANFPGCGPIPLSQQPIIEKFDNFIPEITWNGSLQICTGENIELIAPNATSYLWSNGQTSQSITVSEAGNYFVTITDINNCVFTSEEVTVIVNPIPTPEITVNGSLNLCQGETTLLTASGGTTYLWSNGATTPSITVSEAGTFTVTAFNGTCEATSTAVVVNVTPNPTLEITVNGALNLCQGETTVLTASGGTTYLWSNGATTPSITVSEAGTFTVTAFNGTCEATSTAVVVNVTPIPTPEITVNGSLNLCQGETTVLTASGGTTYLWSNGATTPSITVSEAGTFTVTAFNGTCEATSTAVVVNVTPNPTLEITVNGALNLCQGETTVLTASGGTTYLWSNGATTPSITVSEAGTFTVTAFNGTCEATSTAVVVNVTPIPTPEITVNGSLNLCQGETTVLTASGGTTYLWSNGATTPSITVSEAGTFTVTAFNGTCEATSTAVLVNVTPNPTPEITVNGSLNLCQGETTVLTASGGTTYLWSNGATTPSITVSEAGTFTVTAFNGTCEATSTAVVVTVTPNPEMPVSIIGSTEVCQNSTQTFSVSPVAGATSYLWTLPNGWTGTSNTNVITVNTGVNGGVISVAAINSCGQSLFQTLNVFTTQVNNAVVQNETVLTALISNAQYQWFNCETNQIIPGAINQSFTPDVSGIYAVIITFNGCEAVSDCFNVTILNSQSFGDITIQLFPNPVDRIVHFKVNPISADHLKVTVWNLMGQELIRGSLPNAGNGVYSLQVEHLPQGNYMVKVQTAEREQIFKFTKN